MIDVADKPHDATAVEDHRRRSDSTGGQWRNALGDAIVGEGHPHIDRRSPRDGKAGRREDRRGLQPLSGRA